MADKLPSLISSRWILAISLLTADPISAASDNTLLKNYLERLAGAMASASKCPDWVVDMEGATLILSFFRVDAVDIAPGGKYWPMMSKLIIAGQNKLRFVDKATACRLAGAGFGPHGSVAPSMMKPK